MHYPISLDNAGLVLAAPFLPNLWSQLDMLAQNADGQLQWKDGSCSMRAPQLLQWFINGAPHPANDSLALNMALCGMQPGISPPSDIHPSPVERQACDALIHAMLAHWTALSATSVEALRDSFLQRPGKLDFDGQSYRLTVEPRSFDRLLDRIPWTFAIIHHPWMPFPITIDWCR